ncbi:hypothetical protein GCM10027280_46280 [Micromonospora polyrhachis]
MRDARSGDRVAVGLAVVGATVVGVADGVCDGSPEALGTNDGYASPAVADVGTDAPSVPPEASWTAPTVPPTTTATPTAAPTTTPTRDLNARTRKCLPATDLALRSTRRPCGR